MSEVQTRQGTRLTNAKLSSLKAGTKVLTHSSLSGLIVKPSASQNGVGTWYFRFKSPITDKRAKMKIGIYPSVGLVQAEDIARKFLRLIASGQDPRQEVALAEKSKLEAEKNTFSTIAMKFYERQIANHAWKNERYTKQWIRELKNHVFPKLGSLPIDSIVVKDIVRVMDPIWNKIPDTATKILDRINQVFTFAEAMEYCVHNPCPATKVALGKQRLKPKTERRMPAMHWQDVPKFVNKVLIGDDKPNSYKALLFLILNAARSGAVRQLEFSEIDFAKKIWTMPADGEDRKTSSDKLYPLSRFSMDILMKQRDNDLSLSTKVFSAARQNKRSGYTISDMTLSKICRDHAQEFVSDIKNRVPTVHGFRTSFKSWASEHGYDDKLSELQLAHEVGNAVQQAYDRNSLIDRRRLMMDAWEKFVLSGNKEKLERREKYRRQTMAFSKEL